MTTLLFAPTDLNAANLSRENVKGRIFVTGNTGIDSLLERAQSIEPTNTHAEKCRLLVTCHRRESWDALPDIAGCLTAIAARGDVAITFVLHPNPRVASEMVRLLGRAPNLELRPPCGHGEMLQLMRESDLILSDSGGVQEEAPALGIPLLILRDRTERPEGIASGNAILVGRDSDRIMEAVGRLLNVQGALEAMKVPALPYGDGCAAPRIAEEILLWLESQTQGISSPEPRSPSRPLATARAAP